MRGHQVTAFLRASSQFDVPGIDIVRGEFPALPDLSGYDVLVSCLASRSGAPKEAWTIDHDAHLAALRAGLSGAVPQFVLLSAMCVQKPRLAFQKAKLAFEQELRQSGLTYSIVRPTAYFKSLGGQVERLRHGRPFLVFGDGRLTACKPISNRDLAAYLADCLDSVSQQNAVLPIGGPGPALTPRDIGELLFKFLRMQPRFRSVPPGFLKMIAAGFQLFGAEEKAEFARTGHYYGTESMLVWDGFRYDADATPETGQDRIEDYFQGLIDGTIADERGAHAVF